MSWRQDNPRIDAILNDLFDACKTDAALSECIKVLKAELHQRQYKRWYDKLADLNDVLTDDERSALVEANRDPKGVNPLFHRKLHSLKLVTSEGHITTKGRDVVRIIKHLAEQH